jgi:hypothetical protein
VIFPVPVTLKRFLALEFVFTLGILHAFLITPLRRSRSAGTLVEPLQAMFPVKLEELEPLRGRKDTGLELKSQRKSSADLRSRKVYVHFSLKHFELLKLLEHYLANLCSG